MVLFRKWIRFLATGMCAFLLCASSAFGEQKLKKLRLAYDGIGVATTVAWVGNQAGLFKQHKVEVEEIFIQDASIGGIQALLGVDIFSAYRFSMKPMALSSSKKRRSNKSSGFSFLAFRSITVAASMIACTDSG